MWPFTRTEQKNKDLGHYVFEPKEDITALEIALFLKACNKIAGEELVSSLPDKVRRHFKWIG